MKKLTPILSWKRSERGAYCSRCDTYCIQREMGFSGRWFVMGKDEVLGTFNTLKEAQDYCEEEEREKEEFMLRTTCHYCGDPAMPKTFGEGPRCERHRDV